MAIGLLVARLVFGLGVAAHGAQKLFGWFGGYGLKGTGGFFEGLGFRPGHVFALAAGLGEFAGGLLMAAGLFGALGPALVIVVMLVAMASVHWGHGFFAQNNGVELPLLYLVGALAFAFLGEITYTLDRALGLTVLATPSEAWGLVAVAVVGAAIVLALRRTAAAGQPVRP
jgi:putative oxidoreductase